jgi:hypothetical protein
MNAEDWAGFTWVIGIWEKTVLELLASSSPVIAAMSEANVEVALIVCTLWWILVTVRVADVGFIRGLVAGVFIIIGLRVEV